MVLIENKILVTVDGFRRSQIAIDYALWLGKALNATIFAQHVIDPHLMDLLIAPEFAECLGFATSVDSAERVEAALRKIGSVILELFSKQAARTRSHVRDLSRCRLDRRSDPRAAPNTTI